MKRSSLVVALAAVLATLVAATAAFAAGPNGKVLYRYTGELTAKTSTSVTVTVENGNRPALRSLLGKSQEETFATGDKTVFLRWTHGIPTQVDDRRPRRRRLRDRERPRRSRRLVRDDRGDAGRHRRRPRREPRQADQAAVPLPRHFVSTGGGKVTIDVKGGNRRALRLMIGQTSTQSFSIGDETVFLHWAHRIPTVIDASSLKAGDRIVVRVRADGGLEPRRGRGDRGEAHRRPRAEGAGVEPERTGVANEAREHRAP